VLAYRSGNSLVFNQIDSFDRPASRWRSPSPRTQLPSVDLSRDGKRLVATASMALDAGSLWLFDLARAAPAPSRSSSRGPCRRLVARRRALAFAALRQTLRSARPVCEAATAPDATSRSLSEGRPSAGRLVARWPPHSVRAGRRRRPRPLVLPTTRSPPSIFLKTVFDELTGSSRPTILGAYTSTHESADTRLVQPFPASGAKFLISPGAGRHPRWNPTAASCAFPPEGA